ncbi:hypothetical protein CAPTEDRAFT_201955 [Capitella teleta]|uniref:Nucleotide-diphospho-sugar transferase domain-containing protein n=1 Tax=Capitella teleta TaxID=283909 RepID=R7TD20_CAPTE|nr:hypothetical protein CAPTEDRAFT_201955 [Capitella teleta]|eukprot:ELT91377.1 hypothetical protein CAPTEDRAFT_201955 [Capitella teleta]
METTRHRMSSQMLRWMVALVCCVTFAYVIVAPRTQEGEAAFAEDPPPVQMIRIDEEPQGEGISTGKLNHPMASALLQSALIEQNKTNEITIRNMEHENRNWTIDQLYPQNGIQVMKQAIHDMRTCKHPVPHYATFKAALDANASPQHKVITLAAVIDHGYLPIAENIYITSFRRHFMQNFLYVCVDFEACEAARLQCMPVFLYMNASHKDSGDMNSQSFREKSMLKLQLAYEAMAAGYTVFLTDLDVFFFRNPLPKLLDLCQESCDLVGQRDVGQVINTGFMLLRPTNTTIRFYHEMLTSPKRDEFMHDQTFFNYMFPNFKSRHRSTKVILLSEEEFPEGRNYFRNGRRFFYDSNPCEKCFEVHNNWIVGTRAKTLRFQEHLMWMVDDGGYYSNPDRKYLTYYNPAVLKSPDDYFEWESVALRNAVFLSELTGRTLIFPRFHANASFAAPIFSIFKVNLFTMYFHNHRESSFLLSPLVPDQVKKSLSPWLKVDKEFHIGDKGLLSFPDPQNGEVLRLEKDGSLQEWVKEFDKYSVIRLASLYDPRAPLNMTSLEEVQPMFVQKMRQNAIVKKYSDNNIIS